MSVEEEIEYLKLLEFEDKNKIELDWFKGNLRYKLHAAQRKIYDAVRALPPEARDVVVYCARRFGKTVLGIVMAMEDCLRNPGVKVYIVGPELAQTMEIVEEKMDLIASDAPTGLITKIRGGRRYEIGQSLLVIGAYDKKNVKKAKGKEAFSIYTEEACESKSEEFAYGMREVYSPLLLHSKGRFVHNTTPPPDLDHVFVTEYVPKAKLANTFFKFTIHENPLVDQEMFDQAVKDSGGSVECTAFKRNYLVEEVRDGSLVVLPSFHETHHVSPVEIPQYAVWQIFGDMGGTRDKTWFALGFWNFRLAKFCVVAERVYDRNTSTAVIAPGFGELESIVAGGFQGVRFIDAAGQTKVDLMTDHKIMTQLPAKDDFDAAINQLELAFVQNKIQIDPACKFLIASCQHGRFNRQRNDFNRTEELGHCDAIAGLMYGWRMIDKTTNPYPALHVSRQTQFNPERTASEGFEGLFKRF